MNESVLNKKVSFREIFGLSPRVPAGYEIAWLEDKQKYTWVYKGKTEKQNTGASEFFSDYRAAVNDTV